jgi:ligand-binding sensor domain-containing protein/signal transduction histidine kinase
VESSAVALRFGSGILAMLVLGSHSISAQTRTVDGPVKFPVIDKHDIRFIPLSVDGQSLHARIWSIVRDDYGILWMGTSDGVYRYDGYSLKRYRNKRDPTNRLSDDPIRFIYKDRAGILWLGTTNDGLYRLDPTRDNLTNYRHNPGDSRSLIDDRVRSVYQDRNGVLWFGTVGGLDSLDQTTGAFIHYRHGPQDAGSLSDSNIQSLLEDRRGNLWVGTSGGLNKLDRATGRFSHFLHDPGNPHSLGHDFVGFIMEDRSGVLWVTSPFGNGLSSLDVKTGSFTRYSFHAEELGSQSVVGVNRVFEDSDGGIWVCTVDMGLLKFDRDRKRFLRYARDAGNPNTLPHDTVQTIFEDVEGVIWVGTQSGLCRFPRRPAPFVNYRHQAGNPNSLRDDMIWSAQADSKGCLWIGTEYGLDRLDRKTGQFTLYQHDSKNPHSLSYDKVAAIQEDRAGGLWLGTYGAGLDRFDPASGRFFAYRHDERNPRSLSSDSVRSLLMDRRGVLWVGTQDGGLNRFDAKTKHFTAYRAAPALIQVIFEDRAGILWLGSENGGLYRFDPTTEQFTFYRHDSQDSWTISSDRVHAICEDRNGTLWVGTQNGLDRMDRSLGTFTAFTTKDGLPGNTISAILEDARGYLWVATHDGLSRFDPRNRSFRNYSESDGLPDNFLSPYLAESSAETPTGEIIFGSSKGLTTFYPDRLSDNSYVPPVVITDFLLFNKSVDPGAGSPLQKPIWATDSLTLTHRQNILTLEFSALSYTAPENNRYRYRLESLETQWNEVGSGRRTATYTNLPAGKYTFRVQGSNNDGVWNSKGVSLAITVLPPWWATWWFRSILSLTIAALAIGAYRARIRQLNLRFEDRLAERTHIAQELHDTLIQDMVAFGLQLDIIEDQIDAEPSAVKPTVDVVRDRVRQAISRGRHALLDLRSSTATTNDLIESLSRAGMELSTGEVPRFRAFVQGNQGQLHSLIWHELDRIGREAITNAFRHAGARSIEVGLFCSDHAIHLVVRDDGCGMTTSLVSKGRPGHFGLHGMRERAERAGGRLTVRSRHGGGTEVSVTIPLRRPRKTSALLTRIASLRPFGRWIEPPGSHENH